MIKIIKPGSMKQQIKVCTVWLYMDIKLCIMKTKEKITFGFKNEILSNNNPFLNFAKRIKQIDGRSFIVEWQMGGNDKKEVLGKQVYGFSI